MGRYNSLALNASGNPVISYYDSANGVLKLAVCNNATCTAPILTTVDNTGVVGRYNSLALNAIGNPVGNPVISYFDDTNGVLKLAVCNDATCTAPTLRIVDNSTGDLGYDTSLVLIASRHPVISYYDQTNLDLKLAVCNDATCTAPTLTTVDNTGGVGQHTSLALNASGNPVISYYDDTNYDLKVAVCNDATCTAPTLATVDSTGQVGDYTSLVLNASGNPVISYYDNTNDDLKVAPITPTTLVNSVLPTSRTPVVGNMVTIYNTVINAGSDTAYGITLSMNPAPAGTFAYQQTNCATNAIIGPPPNPNLNLAPGGVLCYVLSFTPSATFAATSVHIRAQSINAPSTNLLTGINTWLLRSTAVAGPDTIALTTTVDFHQVACSGADAFAVALSNVGVAATGDITATANTGSASLPLSISISETNPGTGAIIGDNILQSVGAGENRTVAVFVTYNGCVSFDPAANRIFIEFRDASNNVVGSTSTAVSTNR